MLPRTLFALFALLCCLGAAAAVPDTLPKSVTAQYSGSFGIPAQTVFRRQGTDYTLVTQIELPLYRMRFESGGSISENGSLRPRYYQDIRNGKIYAMAAFADGSAVFGKPEAPQSAAAPQGITDLFSLSWQLALNPAALPEGIRFTNGKKIYPAAAIVSENAVRPENTPFGAAVRLNRYTVQRGDAVIRFATAPAWRLPVLIDYADADSAYRLVLQSAVIDGKTLNPARPAP